jgi:hypothetical protein
VAHHSADAISISVRDTRTLFFFAPQLESDQSLAYAILKGIA